MKWLFVGRHGSYDLRTLELDSYGRQQMVLISEALAPYAQGKEVAILSAKRKRVTQSAEIVATKLDTSWEIAECLSSGDNDICENLLEETVTLIEKAAGSDLVILITHVGYTKWLPYFYIQRRWQKEIEKRPLNKGHGWLIDCDTGEMFELPESS